MHQSQALSWLWLAITNNLLWLVLPDDEGMSLAAFCLTTALIFILVLEYYESREATLYILKKQWPPKSKWIKSWIIAMNWCTSAMMKVITNIKVWHRYQPPRHHLFGHRYRRKKFRYVPLSSAMCMTTTWPNGWATTKACDKQFDLDSQTLMLDNACQPVSPTIKTTSSNHQNALIGR